MKNWAERLSDDAYYRTPWRHKKSLNSKPRFNKPRKTLPPPIYIRNFEDSCSFEVLWRLYSRGKDILEQLSKPHSFTEFTAEKKRA